jgi:hypothetical protein
MAIHKLHITDLVVGTGCFGVTVRDSSAKY